MGHYQNIKNYTGELNVNNNLNNFVNDGIAYDWEVPDNMVIGTPGGVSTIHHHPTHGIYGRGWTSSDIYGGDNPRYIAGNYANLYRPGESAPFMSGQYKTYPNVKTEVRGGMGGNSGYNLSQPWSSPAFAGPNFQQIQNMDVPKKTSIFQESSTMKSHLPEIETDVKSGKTMLKENFENQNVVEFLEPEIQHQKKKKRKDINPWVLFFLFLFIFICFAMWASTADLFIKQHVHKGESVSWIYYAVYSLIATAIFLLLTWLSGIPLDIFEDL